MKGKALLKFILFFVLSVHILSIPAFAQALPFRDVPEDAWFYNDVKLAYETGLINGKSSDTFAPDDMLTYAETIKMAACMHQVYTGAPTILDTAQPWYQVYVDYCMQNGIINHSYTWNENITRAEYMDIFSRALPEGALPEVNRVDMDMIPDVTSEHVYADSIYFLYRAGILQGMDATHKCSPDSYVKRSEVAAILTRMMDETKRLCFSLIDTDQPSDEIDGDKDFVLADTPIGKLYFKDRWREKIDTTTSTDGYGYWVTVTGATDSGKKELFKLHIGNYVDNVYVIGYMKDDADVYVIQLAVSEISFSNEWSETDREDILNMQDGINFIISQISEKNGFTSYTPSNMSRPELEKAVNIAKTPVGTIVYPERWLDCILIEESTENKLYTAAFYDNSGKTRVKLFTVYVGNTVSSEYLIGSVIENGIQYDIGIKAEKIIAEKSWSKLDIERISGMQEEMSIIYSQFSEMKGFTKYTALVSPLPLKPEDKLVMNTPVGKLYYSERWYDCVDIEEFTDKGVYGASIFDKMGAVETKLFTVFVGETESFDGIVGTVTKSGKTFYVALAVENLKPDSSWTELDRMRIYGMQEEVNNILDQIVALPGYSK